jgi:hypothetical protein
MYFQRSTGDVAPASCDGATFGKERNSVDVFVSYSRKDRGVAADLASLLVAAGWRIWWDEHLLAGSAFTPEIATQIARARLVVVLWSKASVVSTFVLDEASRAREMGKLAPLRISDVPLPLGFGQLHTLDCFIGKGEECVVDFAPAVIHLRMRLAADLRKPREVQLASAAATWSSSVGLRAFWAVVLTLTSVHSALLVADMWPLPEQSIVIVLLATFAGWTLAAGTIVAIAMAIVRRLRRLRANRTSEKSQES